MFMKYTDNINALLTRYFVKNYVAAYRKSSVTRSDMIASFSQFVIIGQLMKCLVKFSQVLVSLFLPPSFLSEFRNTFQVVFGSSFYSKMRHQ